MNVAYASPNRSHHFRYAEGLEAEGLLRWYVQGYPRFRRAPLAVDSRRVMHRDLLQTLFVPAFRLLNEHPITERLNLASKNSIDRGLCRAMQDAQVGLFYNGCGLHALRHWSSSGKVFVCEAVNCHLDAQSEWLREECELLGLPFREPFEPEREKRLAEYAEADYILCPSQFVARSFASKGIAAKRLLVNPFGIAPAPALQRPGSGKGSGDPFTVLYVGSINYRKGLRYLIEAFDRLKVPGKILRIVGPRLDPDGISDLHLPDGIRFDGVLRGEALTQAYLQADVFVQPSIEEGLSLVIGEAMGHGLPVIATDHTGVDELFADGECGFHVPIRDPMAIADRLSLLAEDESLRLKLSETGLAKSRQFGGWTASQHSLCSLLQKLQPSLS